jgi:hypothetical protein
MENSENLPAPSTLYVSFVKSKMLNELTQNPDQDINELYKKMTKSKPMYDGLGWDKVKSEIIDGVEATMLNAESAGVTKANPGTGALPGHRGKEKKKEKEKAKPKEEVKPPEEMPTSEALPKKMKVKKGVEYEIDEKTKEVIIDGDTKAGVKCDKGLEPFKRQISQNKAGFGCKSTKKGKI